MRGAVALLFLAVLVFGVAPSQEDDNFDVNLFRKINDQQNPDSDGFFEYLDASSQPTFVAIPAGFVLVGAFHGDKNVADIGVLSLCSQLLSLGGAVGLKAVADRPRPFEILSGVKVKHLSSASGSSFPSGHTSQAAAIATIISLRYSRASVTVPLVLWAGLVGFGRIYLGVHFPTDVLGGAVVGACSGFLVWGVRQRLYKVTETFFPRSQYVLLVNRNDGSLPRAELLRLAFPLN